jgi:MFS-type transporter involved in bile tolerance (Atg22 family)
MTLSTIERVSNGPVVVRVIVAVACLVPLVVGLLTIAVISVIFAYQGYAMHGDEAVWFVAFLAFASVIALVPAILLGVILRYARWKRAATASLVLAIVVCVAGVAAAGVARATISPGDIATYVTLLMFSVLGLVAGAVPPALHWWSARDPE